MKKLNAGVFVVMFLLFSSVLFAGSGFYNMAIMDTAQVMNKGKFMITAADDAGFWKSNFSGKWFMVNEPTVKLAYTIIDGLEASLQYNHAFYSHDTGPVTNNLGNGDVNIKYAFGLGDVLRLSLGAGIGVPLDKDNGAVTFTNTPVFQFIPEACLSANIGSVNLHLQLKDRLLMDDPKMLAWLQMKLAIAFDFNGFLAAFTGGIDTFTDMSQAGYTGGPEIIWNVGGPLQINLGVFADSNFGGATVFRGVFRASLLF
jgi:hypothetical protein